MILRVLYLALIMVPFTLIGLPIQLVLLKTTARAWRVLPQAFFKLLALGLGLRTTVYGQPATGPALLVSNHVSWLDIIAIASLVPVRFVAKSEVARYPLVGLFAGLQKTIFVDRNRKADAGRASDAIRDALAAGDSVLLFPEGTSDLGTHVLPFKSALLGAAENALLQPMAIAYTAISNLPLSRQARLRIAWIGDMGVGDSLLPILAAGPKTVAIAFGPPLSARGGRKVLAREAESAVRGMLVALNRSRPLPIAGILL